MNALLVEALTIAEDEAFDLRTDKQDSQLKPAKDYDRSLLAKDYAACATRIKIYVPAALCLLSNILFGALLARQQPRYAIPRN